MATVSVMKATYSDPEIETLLAPLGGMGQFVKKNDNVLLKVNLLSVKGPEKAVTNIYHGRYIGNAGPGTRKRRSRKNGSGACINRFCCHEVCPEDAIMLRNVELN